MLDGDAVLDRTAELEGTGDDIPVNLYAAVYAQALRAGVTPMDVVVDLARTMPDDDVWRVSGETVMRAALLGRG